MAFGQLGSGFGSLGLSSRKGGGGGAAPVPTEYNAFSPLKAALAADAADINILAMGDSVGNDPDVEWVGLFARAIAAQYPAWTIKHRLCNDADSTYYSAVTFQSGTGARTLTFWNSSIPGALSTYLLGAKWSGMVDAVTPGLVMFCYGLNHVLGGIPANIIRGEFLSAIEEVRAAFPSANLAAIIENPHRDDTEMESIETWPGSGTYVSMKDIWDAEAVAQPDLTVCDAFSRFIAAGKDASYYLDTGDADTDNVHPSNEVGSPAYCAAIMERFDAAIPGAFAAGTAMMAQTAANLLPNGSFGAWASTNPDHWAADGGVTLSKETGNKFQGSYAARMTGGASAQPSLRQYGSDQTDASATLASMKSAGFVTLAARMYVPAGAHSSVGRMGIFWDGNNLAVNLRGSTSGQGRYWWRFLPGIPVASGVSDTTVRVWQDTAGAGSVDTGHPVDVDRVVMVLGADPRNMA